MPRSSVSTSPVQAAFSVLPDNNTSRPCCACCQHRSLDTNKKVEERRSTIIGAEGYRAFQAFENQITSLDEQLRQLSNAARQLGSSVGIVSASNRVRERLGRVLHLFRENARGLFPDKIPRKDLPMSIFRRLSSKKHRFMTHLNLVDSAELHPKYLSAELQMFSQDVSALVECFTQFPEFIDEIHDQSFKNELKNWAMSLDEFEERDFRTHAVQRFLYDSMADIGERLDLIAKKFVPIFITIGIPTIHASQKLGVTNLINLATVATLFSGVTATVLQFSFSNQENSLAKAVNAFWFISLIFSISAAVNSLLGVTWAQAIFRSPDHRLPWWVRIWIKRSPLAFLVLSVACFFIGLVLFSYSSGQAYVTRAFTTVLSTLCCCGLAVMTGWFASEWWIYNRYEGYMWLADYLPQIQRELNRTLGVKFNIKFSNRLSWSRLGRSLRRPPFIRDPESELSPMPPTSIGLRQQEDRSVPAEAENSDFWHGIKKEELTVKEVVRYRWQQAIQRTIDRTMQKPRRAMQQSMGNIVDDFQTFNNSQQLKRMVITEELPVKEAHGALVRFLQFSPDGHHLVTSSWDRTSFVLDVSNGKLTNKKVLRYPVTFGFVHQLEWSPAEQPVSQVSQDAKNKVSENRISSSGGPAPSQEHAVSAGAHPSGSINQNSHRRDPPRNQHRLLVRSNRCISMWNSRGEQPLWTETPGSIRSIGWRASGRETNESRTPSTPTQPTGKVACVLVSDNKVLLLNPDNRTVHEEHRLGNQLLVRAVAITTDSKWMLCIGGYKTDGEKSAKFNKLKYEICLYSLETRKVVERAPVYHEMSEVILAHDDRSALVSYENKAAPQLWVIRDQKDDWAGEWAGHLVLKHTYVPSGDRMAFASLPAIFGGPRDHFVLRAGTAEHIYVWDRDTTLLLHRIQIPQRLGHLTAFTWNRRSDVWMFATGTHEGAIHLWTIPPEETQTRGRPSRAKSMPPWSFERTFSGATGISAISSRTASPQGLRSMLEAYPGRPESPAQAGPPQWEDTGNVSGQGPRRRDTVL